MKNVFAKIIDLWENDQLCFWILTVSFCVTVYAIGKASKIESQDAAAWVQAIGSIVAIGASVAVVHRQHKLDIDHRRQEELEHRIQVAQQIKHLIAFACWPGVAGPEPYTTDQKYHSALGLQVEEQERKFHLFEAFPIFEVRDPMPVTQIQYMAENWAEGIRLMKLARDLARSKSKVWESAYDDLTAFPCRSQERMDRLDGYVRDLQNGTYRGYG